MKTLLKNQFFQIYNIANPAWDSDICGYLNFKSEKHSELKVLLKTWMKGAISAGSHTWTEGKKPTKRGGTVVSRLDTFIIEGERYYVETITYGGEARCCSLWSDELPKNTSQESMKKTTEVERRNKVVLPGDKTTCPKGGWGTSSQEMAMIIETVSGIVLPVKNIDMYQKTIREMDIADVQHLYRRLDEIASLSNSHAMARFVKVVKKAAMAA